MKRVHVLSLAVVAVAIGLSLLAVSVLAQGQQTQPPPPGQQTQPPTQGQQSQPPQGQQQAPGQGQEPQAPPKPLPAPPPLPQHYTTLAIDTMSDRPGTGATLLDITVRRWTTPAEREELFGVLREKGMEQFVRLLHDQRSTGFIRATMGLGYDLRFASQDVLPDGSRKLFLITDRPMFFGEMFSGSRTVDYPLTVIEMLLPAKGEGSGTMAVASKLMAAGQVLVMENYAFQPIRLNAVKLQK